MSHKDDLIRDRDYVNDELVRLNTKAQTETLTPEELAAAQEGLDFVARTDVDIKRYDDLEQAAARKTVPGTFVPAAPNVNRNDDPFDLSTLSAVATRSEVRGRAVTAIERVAHLSDRQRAAATLLVERVDTPNGALARHILATGAEAYRTGFQKLISNAGHLMNEAERSALELARALSLTDANGGFAVPFTLDPTIISTKATTTNPFRRISTNRTTVTDQWQGVTSAGMTVSWDGEAVQVSDDSPTLGSAPIPVHKAQGFAVGSIEVLQDWAQAEADLRDMFVESKDDAEAIVFTTGTGTNQPTGIVTAIVGTASEINVATAETFAIGDVYALENALPAKYRLATMDGDVQSARASWAAHRAIYNRIRQFDTQGGAGLWETLGGGLPPRLLGYPTYEASGMDGSFNVAVTENNYILLLGDFRYYVIVDRVGMAVEYVPHVFGANGRPTGQRGWYAYWRVGADSVNDDAFRLLDLPTTL